MKMKLLITLLCVFTSNVSLAANYVLTIGGEQHEISLDKESKIKVGDNVVSVKLEEKDTFLFETDNFSFEHPKEYSPSKSDLGEGIFQTAVMTPLGSTVMIQEYNNFDPLGLIDLMVNEVTKEELEYGYKIESTNDSITLSDGKVLNGRVVTSKYKGSDIRRVFYTYSLKDSGLFILTQIDYDAGDEGEGLIDQVINSLKITMK